MPIDQGQVLEDILTGLAAFRHRIEQTGGEARDLLVADPPAHATDAIAEIIRRLPSRGRAELMAALTYLGPAWLQWMTPRESWVLALGVLLATREYEGR